MLCWCAPPTHGTLGRSLFAEYLSAITVPDIRCFVAKHGRHSLHDEGLAFPAFANKLYHFWFAINDVKDDVNLVVVRRSDAPDVSEHTLDDLGNCLTQRVVYLK